MAVMGWTPEAGLAWSWTGLWRWASLSGCAAAAAAVGASSDLFRDPKSGGQASGGGAVELGGAGAGDGGSGLGGVGEGWVAMCGEGGSRYVSC